MVDNITYKQLYGLDKSAECQKDYWNIFFKENQGAARTAEKELAEWDSMDWNSTSWYKEEDEVYVSMKLYGISRGDRMKSLCLDGNML